MKKIYLVGFSKVEIFKKNLNLRPIFHDLCWIGYRSINRR